MVPVQFEFSVANADSTAERENRKINEKTPITLKMN